MRRHICRNRSLPSALALAGLLALPAAAHAADLDGYWEWDQGDYSTFIKIQGRQAFYCFNDGKSDSFRFQLTSTDLRTGTTEKFVPVSEDTLEVRGVEKDVAYTLVFDRITAAAYGESSCDDQERARYGSTALARRKSRGAGPESPSPEALPRVDLLGRHLR